MADDPTWCMVMFDLPVKTKQQRSDATKFRLLLLDLGFWMVQLSVYAKYIPLSGGVMVSVQAVKAGLPDGGVVRILRVTDNQWATAIRFSNGIPESEVEEPEMLTLF